MTEVTHNTDARSNLKPIETIYKDFRFRSRLEARWAIFFDALGLSWDYEVEGVNLYRYGWYLPDFYLPQVKLFCEVKPIYIDDTEIDINKYKAFVSQTGFAIMLLQGTPDFKFYQCFFKFENEVCEDLKFVSHYHNYPNEEHRFYGCPGCGDPIEERLVDDKYKQAVALARSARFEHGENQ
jgi:hypothetical protein